MLWYNTNKEEGKKHLLIDVKKAFDSINRDKLRFMLAENFSGDNLNLILNFLDIYDTIEIDILGSKIYPTKGGPQGSAIIPIIFCYYLNKSLQNLNLKKGVKLQAYADDMVILSNDIKDLNDSYITLKKSLQNYDLIINPEKCELLSDNIEDKISDEDEGNDILARKEVTYLGQKINKYGEACQIIDEKLFGFHQK